ncbi:MAG: DUF7933 domain-containing protein [Solirubrobacteraceae bacterium]
MSLGATAGLAAGAPAALAASPPTVTTSFTPNLIGFSDSSATALSVTIANPNASGTLSSVSFTDTLPAGLTIDNPNGENGTCGSAGVITANAGSQTISLDGGSVKAGASCTFSVSVVPGQTGTFADSPAAAGSSGGTGAAGAPASLTVLPPPTVTVSHLRNNAKLAFGAVVRPTFSCSQPGDPAGLSDCSAVDDLGNNVGSGHALNTKVPGSHTLTVSATSVDGLVTSQDIDYTVLPANRFTLTKLTTNPSGTVSFVLTLPGAGSVIVRELDGHHTFGTYSGHVSGPRKLKVTVKPNAAGKARLAGGTAQQIAIQVTFAPKGGVKHTVTRHGVRVG